MPWSTQQIADLAGTTVNTVRHYHQTGLLEEPERLSNGYKQYTTSHLVRLLRIRRLAELGIPLSRIVSMGEDAEEARNFLQQADEELQARIAQLQEARSQIASLMGEAAPAHTPPGFEGVGADISEADRAIVQIYSRLYSAEAQADVRSMIESSSEASARFDALPADADEAARDALAHALLPELVEQLERYPWLRDPQAEYSKDVATTRSAFLAALQEIYNPAQLDVLERIELLARDASPPEGVASPPGDDATPPEGDASSSGDDAPSAPCPGAMRKLPGIP